MTGATWIGLDRGDRDLAAAEHLVADVAPALSGAASVACTHVVTDPFGHFAVSLEIPRELSGAEAMELAGTCLGARIAFSIDAEELAFGGPGDFQMGALLAAASHRDRTAGRAYGFPGAGALTGSVAVADVIASSAIDRVDALGHELDDATLVVTRDHVRPLFRDGELVLVVVPRADGTVQPFESATTHACGGDH